MLKFFVRHGMIVEESLEIISFKQSKWLEKYISFNTHKRSLAKNDFQKDFYKLFNNAFYGKSRENVRNRFRLEFIRKYAYEKIIKHSMEFINHMKIVIVIYSKGMKFLWINRFI